ncbi:MAG: hypothetical protein WCC48_07455 [Anaeromyxobacteraceae bacterium]
MRIPTIAVMASMLVVGCSSSSGGGEGSLPFTGSGVSGGAIVSCDWGAGTCDQYSGTIDPTFAANLQTTCSQHGVAFATAACPATNQIAGHCDLATSGGMTNSYFYYSPTYDATTAQADCGGNVVGVTWVP